MKMDGYGEGVGLKIHWSPCRAIKLKCKSYFPLSFRSSSVNVLSVKNETERNVLVVGQQEKRNGGD